MSTTRTEPAASNGIASDQGRTLLEIGERLRTQDNRCTQNPMFCVQEKVRHYGYDPRWTENFVWLDIAEGVEVEEPKNEDEAKERWMVGYQDSWKTWMVAFTEAGCEEYLCLNGHNHRGETRIYVESFNRCPEMIAIREALIAQGRGLTVAPELLALLIESKTSIGGDWRDRRDALLQRATTPPE